MATAKATITSTPRPAPTGRPWAGWALLAAAAGVPLVTASIWYAIFGGAWVRLSGIDPTTALHPGIWPVLGQLGRNAVVVLALTVLVRRTGTRSIRGAVALAVLVWFGFEAMAVLGSVLHEGYPFAVYLIHVGDALQTTLVMAVLIGLAHRPRRPGAASDRSQHGMAGR